MATDRVYLNASKTIWLIPFGITNCKKIIEYTNKHSLFIPSENGAGEYAQRTSKNSTVDLSTFVLGRRFEAELKTLIQTEAQDKSHVVTIIEPVQIIRYDERDEFQLHLDQCEKDEPGCQAENKDWNDTQRDLSVVVYLNEDFQGGETWFPHHQDLKIKPQAGHVLMFTNRLGDKVDQQQQHASLPVLQGSKWIAVTWTRN